MARTSNSHDSRPYSANTRSRCGRIMRSRRLIRPMTAIPLTSRSGSSRRHCSRIRSTGSSGTSPMLLRSHDVERKIILLTLRDLPIMTQPSTASDNGSGPRLGSAGLAIIGATAIAPIAWGTTYIVTTELLPADRPLLAGLARALPAGLALALLTRSLPSGSWWWKAGVLGTLNIGGSLRCCSWPPTDYPAAWLQLWERFNR